MHRQAAGVCEGLWWAAALAGAAALVACAPASAPERREEGRLGRVEFFRPHGSPSGFVILLSDASGWSPAWERAGRALAARGAAVVGVDLREYLTALRASDDGCHYVVAELEDLSKRLQRELGSQRYFSPIVAGAEEGATFAYAALAQAPAVTLAGAVSVDPTSALDTRVAFCPGAPATPAAGAGFSYGARSPLPGFWRVSSRAPLPADLVPLALVDAPLGSAAEPSGRLVELVKTSLEAGEGKSTLRDLPLAEIPAAKPGPLLAVIYSGDGGWRDIDKQIGEVLAAGGMSVVGVDSLGYSFGAGILPFAVNRLPEAERARVVQVSLLGLAPRAAFEFHVSGWLGAASQEDPLVLPELLRLPAERVQCFYGAEEAETLCLAPELAGTERIGTRGGHHFDGDYEGLARRIAQGAERRLADDGRS